MGLTRIRAEQISDIDYKQAVRVISLANVTLAGSAPSQVDGVNLNTGDRILVAGQATASQNGLYDVQTVGTGSNGTWVRTSDANATGEVNAGMIVMVTEGTEYADVSWKLVTNDPIVIGVTGLTFTQNTGNSFSIINVVGSANVVANGVSSTVSFISGNNFSVTGNNASDNVTFSVSESPTFTGNVTGANLLTGGLISATGNITAGSGSFFIGNGSQLTGVAATSAGFPVSNGTSNLNATVNGNIGVSVGGTSNVAIFTTGGELVTGFISATGNITGSNLLTSGLISSTGNATHGNVLTGGLISATGNAAVGNLSTAGNVTAAYLFGNAFNVTGLANVTFGSAPPGNAIIGDIWIDETSGIQYIYFNDVAGNVWAEMEAQTAYSSTGYANLTTNTLNTQVLYNASNAIVGNTNLTFDGTTLSAQGVTVGSALQISANSVVSSTTNSNLTITTTGSSSYVNLTGGFSVKSYGGNTLIQTVSDTVNFYTPLLNSADSAVDIIGSVDGNQVVVQNSGVMLHISGQPTLPSRIYNDGANSYSAYIGRMYNGNASAPTAVLANTVVTRFGATPYGSNGWPALSTARIDMSTTENQNTTNQGTQLTFWTTPQGSNTITQVMSLNNTNLSITGNIVTSGAIISSTYSGNLVPSVDNAYVLGNATNRWANLWLGPGTLYITDTANTANVARLTVYNGILQVNGATGLQANLVSGTTTLTLANSGNITLNAAGSGNTMVVGPFGTAITGNLSVSGNIIGNLQNVANVANLYNGNTSITLANSGNITLNSADSNSELIVSPGLVTVANSANLVVTGDLSVTGNINTVPGTYGSFANVANITAAADNTAYAVLLGNTLVTSGISLGTGVSNSRVIVSKADTYRVQYDVGTTVSGGTPSMYFWLRKNGVDIPYSQISVASTNNNIIQVNGDFIVTLAVNDYVELYWAVSNHNQGQLVATPAQTTPFACPASPSVILTVTPVSV